MPLSLLEPLLRPVRARRHTRQTPRHCPHCRAREETWPIGGRGNGAPLVCIRCGGLVTSAGEPLEICAACALPVDPETHDGQCAGESALDRVGAAELRQELAQEVAAAAERLFELREEAGLARYVVGIQERMEAQAEAVRFIDLGEPVIAALPGRRLLVSLGLLATLDDEAQLAFVLGRELALDRAGWVTRRFVAASRARGGWLAGWGRGARAALGEALELSLLVGYGPEAERKADRDGLAGLVRAGYDPEASLRALRLLESATLAGRGARFLLGAERATWLAEESDALGRTDSARLNREVYRRAVGGFHVFGR